VTRVIGNGAPDKSAKGQCNSVSHRKNAYMKGIRNDYTADGWASQHNNQTKNQRKNRAKKEENKKNVSRGGRRGGGKRESACLNTISSKNFDTVFGKGTREEGRIWKWSLWVGSRTMKRDLKKVVKLGRSAVHVMPGN